MEKEMEFIRDLLRQIAGDNGMRCEETWGASQFGPLFTITLRGKNLIIKDQCIVQEGTSDEHAEYEYHKIRLRVLYLIATAGLKKIEQDINEHHEKHPELYYP